MMMKTSNLLKLSTSIFLFQPRLTRIFSREKRNRNETPTENFFSSLVERFGSTETTAAKNRRKTGAGCFSLCGSSRLNEGRWWRRTAAWKTACWNGHTHIRHYARMMMMMIKKLSPRPDMCVKCTEYFFTCTHFTVGSALTSHFGHTRILTKCNTSLQNFF